MTHSGCDRPGARHRLGDRQVQLRLLVQARWAQALCRLDSNLRQNCCRHSCRAARGGKSPQGRPESSAQAEIPQGLTSIYCKNDRHPNVGRLDETVCETMKRRCISSANFVMIKHVQPRCFVSISRCPVQRRFNNDLRRAGALRVASWRAGT
jgi:hypothetical protein